MYSQLSHADHDRFILLKFPTVKLCLFPTLSIMQGGYVDSGSQVIPLLFMALGQRDVSKVQLGELTPYTYVCGQNEIQLLWNPLIRTPMGQNSVSIVIFCEVSFLEGLQELSVGNETVSLLGRCSPF